MRNRNKLNILVAAVAVCGIAAAPMIAEAQFGRGRQSTGSLRGLINAVERSSNTFRATVERRDDRLDDRREDRRDDRRDERRRDERRRDGRFEDRDRFFDRLEPHVQRMDEAFERLRREANGDSVREGRDEMQQVLRHAREVDRFFGTSTFWRNGGNGNGRWDDRRNENGRWGNGRDNLYTRSSTINGHWSRLRSDINALARAYGLPPIGTTTRRRF